MTDIIKPFTILGTREEQGGRIGVTFQAEKVEITEPTKRRVLGVRSYISIPSDEDVELAVFNFLQSSGWL